MRETLRESIARFRLAWCAAAVLVAGSAGAAIAAKTSASEADRLAARALEVEHAIRVRERENVARTRVRAQAAAIHAQLRDALLPGSSAEAVAGLRGRLREAGFSSPTVEVRTGSGSASSYRVRAEATGSYRSFRRLLAALESSPVPVVVRGFRFDGHRLQIELESPQREAGS